MVRAAPILSSTPGTGGRRLRIAYLAHGVAGANTGVHAKILGQAAAWSELVPDSEIGLFIRCESGTEGDWRHRPNVKAVASSRLGLFGRYVARELLSVSLARWRPDVVYLRQSTVSPSLLALAARIPTVIEINTRDLTELKLRSRYRHLYALATRDLLLRRAAGIVAVSGEIASDAAVAQLGVPVAVVPNGIDLALHPTLPSPTSSQPRLVFVGTPGLPWHGVDKIVRLARALPSFHFDVVGPRPSDIGDAPTNLLVHGSLGPDAVLPILAGADVGIGSLALHRIGVREASPLKVAGYLAAGLPVVVAHLDTRFPDGAPFLLRLENEERNVDAAIDRIGAFVSSWQGRRVSHDDLGPIDSRRIEERRLEIILRAAGWEDHR